MIPAVGDWLGAAAAVALGAAWEALAYSWPVLSWAVIVILLIRIEKRIGRRW